MKIIKKIILYTIIFITFIVSIQEVGASYSFNEINLTNKDVSGEIIETDNHYIFGDTDGLYKIDKDGTNETQLTSTNAIGGLIETDNHYIFGDIAGLYKIDKDGTNETQLTSTTANGEIIETDNHYIFGDLPGLYKIDKDGTNETQLTSTNANGGLIETDNHYIFGGGGLYQIDKDGTNETQLTSTNANGGLIETDNHYIFGGGGLHQIDKDGTNETQLTSTNADGGLIETDNHYIFWYIGGLYKIEKPKELGTFEELSQDMFPVKTVTDNISQDTKDIFNYDFTNITNDKNFTLNNGISETLFYTQFKRGNNTKQVQNENTDDLLYKTVSNDYLYWSDAFGNYYNVQNLTGDGVNISLSEDSDNIYIDNSISFNEGGKSKTVTFIGDTFEKPDVSISYASYTGTKEIVIDDFTNAIADSIKNNYNFTGFGYNNNTGSIKLSGNNILKYNFNIDGNNYSAIYNTQLGENNIIFQKGSDGNIYLYNQVTNQRYSFSSLNKKMYIEYLTDSESLNFVFKISNDTTIYKYTYGHNLQAPAGEGIEISERLLKEKQVNTGLNIKLYYQQNKVYRATINPSWTGDINVEYTGNYYICSFNGVDYFSENCINQNYKYTETSVGYAINNFSTKKQVEYAFENNSTIFQYLFFDYPKEPTTNEETIDPGNPTNTSCFNNADSVWDSIACTFELIKGFFTNAFNFASNFEDLAQEISKIQNEQVDQKIISGDQSTGLGEDVGKIDGGRLENVYLVFKWSIMIILIIIIFYVIMIKGNE